MRKYITVVLFLALVISGCTAQPPPDPRAIDYGGEKVKFRAPVEEALAVSISDGNAARALLLDPSAEKIYISYILSNKTFQSVTGPAAYNSLYVVTGMELASKLSAIYGLNYGIKAPVEAKEVSSREEAFSMARKGRPVIFLEVGAAKTEVAINENMVVASALSLDEVGRDYTDLDLAVDKLLLVLMGRD